MVGRAERVGAAFLSIGVPQDSVIQNDVNSGAAAADPVGLLTLAAD